MKHLSILFFSLVLLLSSDLQASEKSSLITYSSLESEQKFEQLPLSTDIEIDVNSVVSRVKVKQTFKNNSSEWLEGVYQFPLPEDAAVDTLKMHIGQRIIEGEVQEKQQAERTYQQAKNNGQRASIVHQSRANLFTTKLANIAPSESITIEIQFQSLVKIDSTNFSIRMPLGITPRYLPASAQPEVADEKETKQNPQRLATEVTQFNLDNPIERPVTIKVNLNPGFDLALLKPISQHSSATTQ